MKPIDDKCAQVRLTVMPDNSIALARIAEARANRNRRVSHGKIFGRVSQRWLHEIRIDDLRGNFKESLGLYEPAECPLCAERDEEDGRAR